MPVIAICPKRRLWMTDSLEYILIHIHTAISCNIHAVYLNDTDIRYTHLTFHSYCNRAIRKLLMKRTNKM